MAQLTQAACLSHNPVWLSEMFLVPSIVTSGLAYVSLISLEQTEHRNLFYSKWQSASISLFNKYTSCKHTLCICLHSQLLVLGLVLCNTLIKHIPWNANKLEEAHCSDKNSHVFALRRVRQGHGTFGRSSVPTLITCLFVGSTTTGSLTLEVCSKHRQRMQEGVVGCGCGWHGWETL